MNNTFVTKDLYLAGFIYAKGQHLERVNKDGKICWFVFSNKSDCNDLEQQYYSRLGMVAAKEYADSVKTLKELVFARQ